MSPRVLFLCTTSPFGPVSGSGVRTLNLARTLASCSDLTLVAATEREWTAEQLRQTRSEFRLAAYIRYEQAPVRSISERCRKEFDPRYLNTNGVIVTEADRRRLSELMDQHDVVWIHTFKLANAFRRHRWSRSILDADDYPSRFHRSAASMAPTFWARIERLKRSLAWRRREAVWRERFSYLTVCKEADRAHFGGGDRVRVVPNGFNVPSLLSPRALVGDRPRLGMIGDFGYLPNADGLKWFVGEVWPQVKAQIPSVELRLVGKSSPQLAASLGATSIAGLGYVDDPGAEIATWSAMIVPTRVGGGSHLKVAEGLARRVPIVTTSHGTRGYELTAGRHAMICDAPHAFSDACVLLLREPARGEALTEAGWQLFNERYSWEAIGPAVRDVVNACASQPRPTVGVDHQCPA